MVIIKTNLFNRKKLSNKNFKTRTIRGQKIFLEGMFSGKIKLQQNRIAAASKLPQSTSTAFLLLMYKSLAVQILCKYLKKKERKINCHKIIIISKNTCLFYERSH